ncbi:MAG: glycosyltransferase family 2 protein [Chitinophagaceae bacterium]|nr:MAG: glycosyltransferase family 2 protein [Chitinophagaceae bacterium]
MLDLSIVIVTYNSEKHILKCVDSILREVNDISFEIVVVDNNSTDSTKEILIKKPKVKLIANKQNVGFARANNQGIEEARGEFVMILNPDIVLTKESKLKNLMTFVEENPSTGIVSARLFYEDGNVQESARQFPSVFTFFIRGFKLEKYFNKAGFYQKNNVYKYLACSDPVRVDWVIGAFMFTKKKILEQVGSFDDNFFMYYEDADLCDRIQKKGYEIIYYPEVSAVHAYCRESAKPLISKLKLIHLHSFFRFYLKKHLKSNPITLLLC